MNYGASAGRVGWTVQPAVPLGQDTSPRRVQRSGPRRVLRPGRTTTPRLGGGVGTSFLGPKLAVSVSGRLLPVGSLAVQVLRMLRCKKSLQPNDSAAYVVHRSNAAPGRAVCFLGRFLPKLGGAARRRHFLPGIAQPPHVEPGASAARRAPSDQRSGRRNYDPADRLRCDSAPPRHVQRRMLQAVIGNMVILAHCRGCSIARKLNTRTDPKRAEETT